MLEFTIWSFFYEFRKRSIDKNNKDNTPLHYAVERDKKEIVEKLLQEWKADVNAKNNKGDTPLHIAVSRNNKKLVSLLLDKQARGDIKNNEGKAPYELAKNQEVSYIFKHRSSHSSDYDDIMSQANLNEELIKIVKSSTSEKQKSNDIEDLLKKGANINFQDANYELNTPLHAAVRKQEPKVVKLLVKNGAIQIKNSKGKMPLDIAKSLNNEGIIRELGRASLL